MTESAARRPPKRPGPGAHTALRAGRRARALRLVALFAGLAVVMTWPLALHMGSSLPENLGDPLLNAWIMGWGSQRLLDGGGGLWTAPIFFPYPLTFAYSEHLLGVTLFVAPIHWLTDNALLAYNTAFLGSYVLAAAGAFALARGLVGRTDAALLAALAFAFSPYRTGGEMARLQILMAGWFAFALLGLHAYLFTRDRRWLVAFALGYLLGALSNVYLLYFFAVPVIVIALHGLLRMTPARPRVALELLTTGAAVLLALAPTLWPYYLVKNRLDVQRTAEENVRYSADLTSYLHVWTDTPLSKWLPAELTADRALFPGFTVIALALFAVGRSIQSGRASPRPVRSDSAGPVGLRPRQIVAIYGTVAVVALLLSLGPRPRLWGDVTFTYGPYSVLKQVVPGLDGLRVPARFAVVVNLALVVLAATGAGALLGRLRRRPRIVVTAGLAIIVLAEGYRGGVPLSEFDHRLPSDWRAAYDWIERGPPGAILELPVNDFTLRQRPVANASPQMAYQYATLFHSRRIVNGTSGFYPPLMEFFQGMGSPFLTIEGSIEAIDALRSLGVRYVVLHLDDFADQTLAWGVILELRKPPARAWAYASFGPIRVLALTEAESAHTASLRTDQEIPGVLLAGASGAAGLLPLVVDGDPSTRWVTPDTQEGGEWVDVTFAERRDVVSLHITMGAFAEEYPRLLVVESHEPGGEPLVLFSGSVVPHLIEGLVRSPDAHISLPLAPTRTQRLRLRQVGRSLHRPWSIPELRVCGP